MKKLLGLVLLVIVVLLGFQYWSWISMPKSDPQKVFNEYVKSFQKKDFEKMYRLTSQTDMKLHDFTKGQFLEKYEAVYTGINLKEIDIHEKKWKTSKKEKGYSGYFVANLSTFLGNLPVRYDVDLVKEEGEKGTEWKVQWNPSLILAEMDFGDQVRVTESLPVRGEIVDRNGIPLAKNGEAYELGIIPGRLDSDKERSLQEISRKFDIPLNVLEAALNQKWVKPELFVPIAVMPQTFQPSSISHEEFPGVSFQVKKVRQYPLGEGAAHLLGYVKTITAEDMAADKEHYYEENDVIGKAGLERTFEKELRGKKGGRIVIQNSSGQMKKVLMEKVAVDGKDIQLTIHSELQNSIYQQFKHDTGAVSAMNPTNGELLALVSYPSYDPNLMVTGMSAKQWDAYTNNLDHPFINRFSSVYAPGSTFKAITAAVGMTAGTTYPEKKRDIHGLQWKEDESWGGYYVTRVKDASPVNMNDALAFSDNIYFAQEALEMGADAFQQYAIKYGFNEDFRLPFALQKSQLSNKGINSDILLADSSYGQGEVLMSPVHLGVSFTPFANNGYLVLPKLMKNQTDVRKVPVVSSETANVVKNGLIGVVERPNGTAHSLYMQKTGWAAKTGTAELKKKKGETGTENGFLVAFNSEHPSILISALVEDVSARRGSHYVTDQIKPVLASYVSFLEQ